MWLKWYCKDIFNVSSLSHNQIQCHQIKIWQVVLTEGLDWPGLTRSHQIQYVVVCYKFGFIWTLSSPLHVCNGYPNVLITLIISRNGKNTGFWRTKIFENHLHIWIFIIFQIISKISAVETPSNLGPISQLTICRFDNGVYASLFYP